ncbi:MAG: hypothetical protein QOD29_3450, partial [Alphaproteobacteria bacterium]|nr:hypothetical protein [Alphaproteobacteria bacterium]
MDDPLGALRRPCESGAQGAAAGAAVLDARPGQAALTVTSGWVVRAAR